MKNVLYKKYFKSFIFSIIAILFLFASQIIPYFISNILTVITLKRKFSFSDQMIEELSGLALFLGLLLLFISIIFIVFDKKINEWIILNIINDNKIQGERILNLIVVVGVLFFITLNYKEIYNGFFLWDDFGYIPNNLNLNHILIPQSDRAYLFRLEMSILYYMFGFFSLPYNIFVVIIFIGIIIFSIEILKKFQIGIIGILTFLVLFIGFAQWRSYLSGFYVISIYLQSILFFLISCWLYLQWEIKPRKFLLLFLFISLCCAVLIDIAGIWTIPYWLLFTFIYHLHKNKKVSVLAYIKGNIPILIIFLSSTIIIIGFYSFIYFVLYPNSFLTSEVAYGYSIMDYIKFIYAFIGGTFLTIFINNEYFRLLEISFNQIPLYVALFVSFSILSAILIKYFKNVEKYSIHIYVLYFLFLLFGISLLIVYGRPPIPDRILRIDARYVGMPVIILMLIISIIIDSFYKKILVIERRFRFMNGFILVSILYILNQQILSYLFYRFSPSISTPAVSSAIIRKQYWNDLRVNLVNRLDSLGKVYHRQINIPNLDGSYINSMNTDFSSADLSFFYNHQIGTRSNIKFIGNNQMNKGLNVSKVNSLYKSTNTKFFELLRSKNFANFYFFPVTLKVDTSFSTFHLKSNVNLITGKMPIFLKQGDKFTLKTNKNSWNPEQYHYLELVLILPQNNIPIEMNILFNNDFNQKGSLGKVKIDFPNWCDYNLINLKNSFTYKIRIDLLQIYAYSLSKAVGNISLELKGNIEGNVKIDSLKLY